MSYRIITDSCCDFPQEMYDQLQLSYTSLSVTYKGESHSSYTRQWMKQMYDGLRQGEDAKTAAANPQGWEEVMEPWLEQGEDLLVMAFSSGLSTTYQSAEIAAEELRQKYPERTIFVVDTLCASLGQGLLVYYACKKRDEGMALEDLYNWVQEKKFNLAHWFTVDDLMFLKRGGRVSAATALLGTMLQIKPVLHLDNEGHLISMSKARGRKASIDALAKKVAETGLPGENDLMYICHGDCEEDALYLAEQLKAKYGAKEVFIDYTGAVIGSHSGPGTLALFFLATHR